MNLTVANFDPVTFDDPLAFEITRRPRTNEGARLLPGTARESGSAVA